MGMAGLQLVTLKQNAPRWGMSSRNATSWIVPAPSFSDPGATPNTARRWAALISELQMRRGENVGMGALGVLALKPEDPDQTPRLKVCFIEPDARAPNVFFFGRHERCDVGEIPGASLRHAVVLTWPNSRGKAVMEVIDLHTPGGLALTQGGRGDRLLGHEALRTGIGEFEVILLWAPPHRPFTINWPDELNKLEDLKTIANAIVVPEDPEAMLRVLGDKWVQLDDENSSLFVEKDESSGDWHRRSGKIRVARDVQIIRTTKTALQRGFLLGRYPRCDGLAASTDNEISRVHALLLAREKQLWVIDTASHNGTQIIDVKTGAVRKTLTKGNWVHPLAKDEGLRLGKTEVVLGISS
jgi:hypothetical protein